jgi:hypothetical protein
VQQNKSSIENNLDFKSGKRLELRIVDTYAQYVILPSILTLLLKGISDE